MQLRTLASLIVFIGSYLPLTIILLVQDAKWENSCELKWEWSPWADQCTVLPTLSNAAIAVSALIVTLICLLLSLGVLRTLRAPRKITIIEAKHIPTDLMNYALPYIVSFMGLDYSSSNKLVGFLVFIFWIFWISHRSGRAIYNPVLIAFNWRLYEIKYVYEGGKTSMTGFALSKTDIHPKQTRFYGQLQDVLIVKE